MDQDTAIATEEEVDLRDLLSGFFSNWLLISCFAFAFSGLFGYYAFSVANPKFSSLAVFELPQESNAPRSEGLSSLASLSGLSLGSNSFNVEDLVIGRNFILDIIEELNLVEDEYFNPYLREPGPVTRFLGWVGINDLDAEKTPELIMSKVLGTFRKSLAVSDTLNGAWRIAVTHEDPEMAALITNTAVKNVLEIYDARKIVSREKRINFLSDELTDAQIDLDRAVEAMQGFAVENNLATNEELFVQSQQLVRMRDRKDEVPLHLAALEKFHAKLKSFPDDRMPVAEMEAFLDDNPILRDRGITVWFGRLDRTEDWLKVSASDVEAAIGELTRLLVQLEYVLEEAEIEAEITAESAGALAKLERNVKVANVAFEIMTEQFKNQSLLSGLDFAEGRIYETAIPALEPSSPKKVRLIIMGFLAGMVIGINVAVFRSIAKGSVYSRRALKVAFGPSARMFLRRKLPGWSLVTGDVTKNLPKRYRNPKSAEHKALSFAVNSGPKTVAVVPASDREAPGLSALLAGMMTGDNQRLVVLDFSGRLPVKGEADGLWKIENLSENLHRAQPLDAKTLNPQAVAQSEFSDALTALIARYDRALIVLPPIPQSNYLLEALGSNDIQIVSTAKVGKITRGWVKQLVDLLPESKRQDKGVFVLC